MTSAVFPISFDQVRYIKLGAGGSWFPGCKTHGRLEFGHSEVPHELAEAGDRGAIAQLYLADGRKIGDANDYVREVMDFFHLSERTMWITFAEGCLWWTFAKPGVHRLGETAAQGERYRELLTPWSNRDAEGGVLSIASLSTRLTKVAAYRKTICGVESADYVLRRINAEPEPIVKTAQTARDAVLQSAATLVAGLHWRDFEVLCDLMFARSGWQRVAESGGLQKDTDLVVEQIATGERAFVQIKSSASPAVLRDYVQRFEADPGFDRMFFVCHSPAGNLVAPESTRPCHVWVEKEIARQAVAAGLFDWLIEKAG